MTTMVKVNAHAGWPVRVRLIEASGTVRSEVIVPPGKEDVFHIWDGCDLEAHELPPVGTDPKRGEA